MMVTHFSDKNIWEEAMELTIMSPKRCGWLHIHFPCGRKTDSDLVTRERPRGDKKSPFYLTLRMEDL